MKIVYVGSGAFGVPSLRALAGCSHQVSLVVSGPDKLAGRKKKLLPCPLAAAAADLGLSLFKPERINSRSSRETLTNEAADVFVVASFGQILRQSVLDLPTHGCLNIHGSLLPRHRGASPIQGAILAGDTETGVSIMRMDAGLDTGPVLGAVSTPLESHETAGELHDRLAELATPVMLECLDGVESGILEPVAQDENQATLTGLINKQDGWIPWDRSSEDLARFVRAMTPWPGAFTSVKLGDGRSLRLILERVEREEGQGAPGEVLVARGEDLIVAAGNAAIRVIALKPSGRKSLETSPFLRGYPVETGARMYTEE